MRKITKPSWWWLIFVVLVLLAIWGINIFRNRLLTKPTPSLSVLHQAQMYQDRQKIAIKLDNQPITVEIVNTPASITQGLSGRSELGADGMLFVHSHAQPATYWMKDMRFNLDFVWIRDGQVIGVTENVPAPEEVMPDDQLPVYSAPGLVDMVLELPAGTVTEFNIYPGMVVSFPS